MAARRLTTSPPPGPYIHNDIHRSRRKRQASLGNHHLLFSYFCHRYPCALERCCEPSTHTFSGAKMLPGSPGTCASPLGNDDASGIPSEVFYWAYISSLVGFIPSIAFVVFFLNSFQIVDNCSMGWYQICFLQKHHVTPRHFNHFSAISMSLCFCSKGDVTATAVHYLFRPAQGEVGSRARARARADFLPSSRLLGSSAEAFWLLAVQCAAKNPRQCAAATWHTVACGM
jgi:hypothetical protein